MSRRRAVVALAFLWASLAFLGLFRGIDPLLWGIALPATLIVSLGIWGRSRRA